MKQWRCTICGYIHTGETPPDVCPVCGADSSFFEEVTAGAEEGSASAAGLGKAERNSEAGTMRAEGVTPGVRPAGSGAGESLVKGGPKQALHKITYGLFIVSSRRGEEINAQCANTVFQITSEPATVAIGINKSNYTHDFIEASGVVGISILDRQGHNLARRFGYRSGRDGDKFAGIPYRTGMTGVPLPEGCLGFLEGKVRDKLDCGTHTLYLLDVVNGGLYSDEEPMTYGYFRASK
ncbi:Flavin reductase like domain protein [Acididesulfobacillus acetoxydans]|uniref:Flavin reductase like domain protein n=1 Tax=Acididesulfobacillus acetoxydans TaxID=1561005 RepID=A0A8S0WQR3_9FIRM|nr:flavin reductase [Acididesulfobacillus acetoxydans]CAA7602804.1 Flavin reductase like domain protein [Acididesulfobacillus acetoxydans]CEJ06339.1 High molecular weight rubredoxin [Acididesulfobacillus acetoxydans]